MVMTALVGGIGLGIIEFFSFKQFVVNQYPFLLTGWQTLDKNLILWAFLQATFSCFAVVLITKAYQNSTRGFFNCRIRIFLFVICWCNSVFSLGSEY